MSKKINTSGPSSGFIADPTITPFPINWNRLNKIRFEDAPTDYILLCKLAEKYNEIVETTNSLEEAMEQFFAWANSELEETANNKLNEWLEDGTLKNIINNEIFGELNNRVTSIEDSYIHKQTVLTIDSFEGDTNEDKLYNALNTIDRGAILCAQVTLTKKFTPNKNKDFRNIQIVGADILLNIDEWWDMTTLSYTYNYMPQFVNCHIRSSNEYTMVVAKNIVGLSFDGCYIENLKIFDRNVDSNDNFVQSFIMRGCYVYNDYDMINTRQLYDPRIDNCRIEKGNGVLLKSWYSQSYACYALAIVNSVIESRTQPICIFPNASTIKFSGNYTEANGESIIEISGTTSSNCLLTVDSNYFNEQNEITIINVKNSAQILSKCFNNNMIFGNTKSVILNKSVFDVNDKSFDADNSYNGLQTYAKYAGHLRGSLGSNRPVVTWSGSKWVFDWYDYLPIDTGSTILLVSTIYTELGSPAYRSPDLTAISIGRGYVGSAVKAVAAIKPIVRYQSYNFEEQSTSIISNVTVDESNGFIHVHGELASQAANGYCKIAIVNTQKVYQLTTLYS